VPCKIPEEIEILLQQPCLGVNLSPLLARYATQGDIAQWTVLAAAILERLIVNLGLPLLLVPHVISQDGDIRMDDEIFLQNVRRTMSVHLRGHTAVVPRSLNCENLKWVIGRTMAFIGARTHSTIAALSSNVPCLSIAYSRKAWGINELVFGHRDWVFSSTELHAEQLCERVGSLVQHRQEIQAHLNDVMPGLIDATYDAAKLLYAVIPEQQVSYR
jgi:polysaccharide pyruvyl transferase WcaK-like protein